MLMHIQSHDFKLSAGELSALKLLARNLSCPDLSYCEDFKCYKGHVCVHDIRGRCDKADCYFAETHGVDPVRSVSSQYVALANMKQKPALKVYEDGRNEVLP